MRAAMPKSTLMDSGTHLLTSDLVVFIYNIKEFVGHLLATF
jgi:hypothetical protein